MIKKLAILAVMLTVASCAAPVDEYTAVQYGVLDMGSISSSVSIDDITRAATTDDFVVTVRNDHDVVLEPTAISDLPATLTLPVDTYTIEASSPVLLDAGWECPWYCGTSEVTITKGQTTTPDPIVCTLGNVKTTVRFSANMMPFLGDDVVVYVSIEGGGEWQFTPVDTQAAYLRVPPQGATMTVRFTGTLDGTKGEEYTETVTVHPGEWQRVRFTFEENEGARTFLIVIFDSEAGQITDGDDWF
jgi:hypothetical protein